MNEGVVVELTTTFIVVVLAHWPAVGMKVYIVVPALVVLIVAGDHVPVMLLLDVVAKVAGVPPTQYGPACVNVGVTLSFTKTFMFTAMAHCPPFGVKVYVVVPALAVLIVAGDHVPVMPFVDVDDNVAGVTPTQ